MTVRGLWLCGTDTDAGKTVVTAGLALALARALRAGARGGLRVLPVKPVQTGISPDGDTADARCYAEALTVLKAGQGASLKVELMPTTGQDVYAAPRTLRTFPLPASPHLAARHAGEALSVQALSADIRALAAQESDSLFLLEGAGGVMVPLNAHESMLDLMAELDMPVLLVVRNQLGALNHALLSLQALRMAGLRVAGVVCVRCAPWPTGAQQESERLVLRDNVDVLRAQADVPQLWEVPHCADLNHAHAHRRAAAWGQVAEALAPAAQVLLKPILQAQHEDTSALLDWDRQHLWHPYTSASKPLPVLEVTRTRGTRIVLRDGRELIDGMSSWWCAVHGYGHGRLVAAAQRQAARMSHVMFGGLTHAPAVELGQKLLPLLPQGLEHIFFADSGSVAVEVALKMALQSQALRCGQNGQKGQGGQQGRSTFLAPLGGYHGDTLGAMSVCDPVNGMHGLFAGMLARQIFIPRPDCAFDTSSDPSFDPASLHALEEAFAEHGPNLAACILEPVVQGAGGMWFYHPEYLRHARRLCDAHGVLLIFDEIATGFGRTGKLFAAEWAGVSPDILCLGKALTGGMMTLAATACTAVVAQRISQGEGVFMHGPTFMGNPLACAVAVAALDELLASPWQERVALLEQKLKAGLESCRGLPGVRDVRVLGGIGVVETEQPVPVAALQAFFVAQGVWIRPFARLIYLMPPYTASEDDVAQLTTAVALALRQGIHLTDILQEDRA